MKRSLLVLITTCGLIVPVALASGSAQVETVGDFAMKLTAALGAPAVDARTAVASLGTLGCRIDDPAAPLTERGATGILADLGLRVLPPADPSKPVSSTRATALAALAGMTVTAHSSSDPVTLPTQCLSESNQGHCVDCCKAATNCSANGFAPFNCNVCSHFCKAVIPPLSGPEPQP